MHTCAHVSMCSSACVCACMYAHVYVRVCVCVPVHHENVGQGHEVCKKLPMMLIGYRQNLANLPKIDYMK